MGNIYGNRPLSQRSAIAKCQDHLLLSYIQEIHCASTRTTLT